MIYEPDEFSKIVSGEDHYSSYPRIRYHDHKRVTGRHADRTPHSHDSSGGKPSWLGSPRVNYYLSCGHFLIFKGNPPRRGEALWCPKCQRVQICEGTEPRK